MNMDNSAFSDSRWEEWSEQFSRIPELSPSELHGLVVGLCCGALPPSEAQWSQILDQLGLEGLDASALRLLVDESEDTSDLLADDPLELQPMVPPDDFPLSARTEALADWCSGVLLGFGLVHGQLKGDDEEHLRDLQQIAGMQFDADEDDEEGELGYAEVLEFARLIPGSLSMGRSRPPMDHMPLMHSQKMREIEGDDEADYSSEYSGANPASEADDYTANHACEDDHASEADGNPDVVEMFHPKRPS